MPLPASGPISIQDVRDFFKNQSIKDLKQLYRGAGIVPDIPQNAHVPTSGAISLGKLHNAYRTSGKSVSKTTSIGKSNSTSIAKSRST